MGWIFSRINWINCSKIIDATGGRLFIFMPIIGYLIIWSESLSEFLKTSSAINDYLYLQKMAQSILDLQSGYEWKLYCLYYGAMFVAFAYGIFRIYCPKCIQMNISAPDYALKVRSTNDRAEFTSAATTALDMPYFKEKYTSDPQYRNAHDFICKYIANPEKKIRNALKEAKVNGDLEGKSIKEFDSHTDTNGRTGKKRREESIAYFRQNAHSLMSEQSACTDFLSNHHKISSEIRKFQTFLCFIPLVIGLMLFFLPSIDTFFAVLILTL